MTVHSEDLPFITKFFTYLPYSVAIAFSYFRQMVFAIYFSLTGKIFFDDVEHVRPGYAPLVHGTPPPLRAPLASCVAVGRP